MKLLKILSLGLMLSASFSSVNAATGIKEDPMGGFGTTAMRFVADPEVTQGSKGTPEAPQKKTFQAKRNEGGHLSIFVNDGSGEKEFPGQKPHKGFAEFKFDGSASISLNPFAQAGSDPDMIALGEALFKAVAEQLSQTTPNIEAAAGPFVAKCVEKLSAYKASVKTHNELNNLPDGAETSGASTTLNAGFRSYLERLKAGVFHIDEVMAFWAYCDQGIAKLGTAITTTQSALATADEKDKPSLREAINKNTGLVDRFKGYKNNALLTLHALCPHGDDPSTLGTVAWLFSSTPAYQTRSIETPWANDDRGYLAFMQKMLSTKGEFLDAALKGNIQFNHPVATALPATTIEATPKNPPSGETPVGNSDGSKKEEVAPTTTGNKHKGRK